MSKFYLMMLRDKDCNGKTYTFAYNMVSEKLDPKLYSKLHAKVEFKTIEEAEAKSNTIIIEGERLLSSSSSMTIQSALRFSRTSESIAGGFSMLRSLSKSGVDATTMEAES